MKNVKALTKKQIANAAAAVIIQSLDTIAKKQSKWSKKFDNVNDSLYNILAECYEQTATIRAAKRDVVLAFNSELKNRGFKRLDATKLETKVTRVVFGDIGANRASGYAKVLVIARKESVKTVDLVDWIKDAGGVEEVRRTDASGKTPTVSREDAITNVLKALDQAPEFDMNSVTKHEGLEYSVIVVRRNADQSVVPVAEVDSLPTVKNVLASLKSLVVDQQSKDDNQFAAEQRKSQAQIIAAVVQQMTEASSSNDQLPLAKVA